MELKNLNAGQWIAETFGSSKLSKWTNRFSGNILEAIYQKYSFQERRTALMVIMGADILMQVSLPLFNSQISTIFLYFKIPLLCSLMLHLQNLGNIIKFVVTLISIFFNIFLLVLCWFRVVKSEKLNWVALCVCCGLISHGKSYFFIIINMLKADYFRK